MTSFSSSGQFTGARVDFFAGQTTDAAGDVALTLAAAPSADTSVFIICNNARRVAHFQSRAGAVVTVRLYRMNYDKPATPISSPSNLGAGFATQAASSVETSSGASVAAVAPTTGIGTTVTPAHTHTVQRDWLAEHKHTLTFAATDQPVAASESGLNFLVIYR